MKRKIQLALVFSICWSFLAAQPKSDGRLGIPQPDRSYSIAIEFNETGKLSCEKALDVVVRITRSFPYNGKVEWKYTCLPCGSENNQDSTVKIKLAKGATGIVHRFSVKARNIISFYKENSYTSTEIIQPPFSISGNTSVLEGDDAVLRVESPVTNENVIWTWYDVQTGKSFKGRVFSKKWFNSGNLNVWSEIEGFKSPVKSVRVNVTPRPDAPTDFRITGPSEITDIESATLRINYGNELKDVRWIWETNKVKIGEGLAVTVKPAQTTVYTVYAEYLWKRSPSKEFRLRVRVLPEPPVNFEIIGPDRINDEQTVWLKVNNLEEKKRAIRWVWINTEDGTQTVGDSISVSPRKRTVFELYADLNGKQSPHIKKVIDVFQLSQIPEVSGTLVRCSNSSFPSKLSVNGGRLGTGSNRWAWYEGLCGSGKFLDYGNEISVSPIKTTRYYVQPENDPSACRQFIVEVGNPPLLPELLKGPELVCAGDFFTIKASGIKPEGVNWNWERYDEKGKTTIALGEGDITTDGIYTTSRYTVRAENSYCKSNDRRVLRVEVRPESTVPNSVYFTPVKRRRYILNAGNGYLAPGAKLVWYKDDCSGSPIGYGGVVRYRASKKNNLYVRAEGICDTTSCTSLSFPYSKERVRYFFLNAGLNSNFIYESIFGYNASVALGNHIFYLKAKAPVTRIAKDKKEVLLDLGVNLETDNTRITNFPTGTNSYYQFNKKFYNESYGASAGIFLGGKVFKLYVGGGYGMREYYWGADIYTYSQNLKQGSVRAKNTIQSVKGPIAEGGIFLRIGSLNLMGGMSILFGENSFQYREVFGGIGFNIINKNR